MSLSAPVPETRRLTLAASLGELRLLPPASQDRKASLGPGYFRNILLSAPGLNTTESDVRAVLAEEADGGDAAPGAIDAAARALIDKARARGWEAWTVAAAPGRPAYTVMCDGAGRCRCDRVLPSGLRETVICDGKTCLHLYPDLGLGGRRTFSRFHRADLLPLPPWSVPAADDLARGADLRLVNDHTVAVVAGDRPCVQLVFAADGRLVERQAVDRPGGKLLGCEAYSANGLRDAAPPDLDPDLKDLVILPMPVRTREYVLGRYPPGQTLAYRTLPPEAALECLAAVGCWCGDETPDVLQGFYDRDDRRVGLQTLLFSSASTAALRFPEGTERLPLRRYGEQIRAHGRPESFVGPGDPPDGFFERLSALHEIAYRWREDNPAPVDEAEAGRLTRFLAECGSPELAWTAACVVLSGKDRPTPLPGGLGALKRRVLEAACETTAGAADLEYAARYELARLLFVTGDTGEARRRFEDLYFETLEKGELPPIDATFRKVLGPAGRRPCVGRRVLIGRPPARRGIPGGRVRGARRSGPGRRTGGSVLSDCRPARAGRRPASRPPITSPVRGGGTGRTFC